MAKHNEATVIYNARPAEFDANRWLDASVTGSGRVWAAVLGAYSNEQILLHRTDLNHGGYTGVLQDVSDRFPQVRKLFSEGKILDAEKLLSGEFAKKGYKPAVDKPLPLAVLTFDFNVEGLVTGYRRTTDTKSGEVEVLFKHGVNGATTVSRGLFAARGSDIVAYSVAKNGHDKINAVMGVRAPEDVNLQYPVIKFESGFVYFAARTPGGLDYGFVARVVAASGTPEHRPDGIHLKNSDGFVMFVKTFNDSTRDTEFKKLKEELLAVRPYDKLLASHETAHKKLFDACTLDLGGTNDTKEDFAMLLNQVTGSAEPDSAVIGRLWNLGKYLAICGVNTGHISFNNVAQLIYGGVMSGVLPDIVLSLFEYFEKYIDDLKKNAARVFGMKGYFVPSVVSPKSALLGAADAGVIHFVASSALAANLFYNYYLVTGDVKTLKSRIFPFMREVCAFYSDFLKLDQNGYYTTVPSYSPSSTPGNVIAGKPLVNFAFAVNSTIDFLAISCLLDNLIEAAAVCGIGDEVSMWRDMKTKIPPYGVGDTGALREYTNSAFIDGAVNCGTMHAYGLWPLKNISFGDVAVSYRPAVAQGAAAQNSTIGLRRASYNAVVARAGRSGSLQNAGSLAMCAVQVAHAGLGSISSAQVRAILLRLLASCFTSSGLCLSNDWRGGGYTRQGVPEFDISGNLGFATAITECIVQSNRNTLRILPSIFAGLGLGNITDVATDFAARVSVDWDMKKGRCAVKIVPKVSCKIDIEICEEFRRVKGGKPFGGDINGVKGISLVVGKTLVVEFTS